MKRKGRKKGAGIGSFLKKAGAVLKKTQAISKVAKTLADVGVPYASQVSSAAGALGYGRRRRRKRGGCKF